MVEEAFEPRLKMRRRKRAHEDVSTEGWEIDTTMLDMAKQASGIICRTCHKLKRWTDLRTSYHRGAEDQVQRVWICRDCGDAVRYEDIDLVNPA